MCVSQWVGSADQGCFPTPGLQALAEEALGMLASEIGTSRQGLDTPVAPSQSGFLAVWPQKGFLEIYTQCLSLPASRKLDYQLILTEGLYVSGTLQQQP